MGTFWNLPARWDGPNCQLGKLIREEAYRHIDLLNEAETDPFKVVEGSKRDEFMRVEENQIWNMVTVGWGRVLPDWSGMVFWNPYTEEFVPWSIQWKNVMKELGESLGALGDAEPYTGEKKPPKKAGTNCYVGKQRFQ